MLAHTPLQESKAQRTLGDWSNFPDNPRKAADQYPWDIWDSAQLNCQRTGAYSKVRRSRICLLSMISPSAMPPYALHTLVIPKCIHSATSVTYSFNQPILPWLSFRCLKFNMSKIKLSLYPFKQQQKKKKTAHKYVISNFQGGNFQLDYSIPQCVPWQSALLHFSHPGGKHPCLQIGRITKVSRRLPGNLGGGSAFLPTDLLDFLPILRCPGQG